MGSVGAKILGAVLGVGSPTESIFQLTIWDLAGEGATGQQPPESPPGTLPLNSLPPPRVVPLEISMVDMHQQHGNAFSPLELIYCTRSFSRMDKFGTTRY